MLKGTTQAAGCVDFPPGRSAVCEGHLKRRPPRAAKMAFVFFLVRIDSPQRPRPSAVARDASDVRTNGGQRVVVERDVDRAGWNGTTDGEHRVLGFATRRMRST